MFDPSNTPDELLHAFIDDELAPESEEQFYANLAADAGLRARLRQMRAIRGEARRFRTAAAPPHDLSDAVFSRLGFAQQSPKHAGRMLGAAILMHRVWTPVASAAVATILTATLILSLQETAIESREAALASRPSTGPDTQLSLASDDHPDARQRGTMQEAKETASSATVASPPRNASEATSAPAATRQPGATLPLTAAAPFAAASETVPTPAAQTRRDAASTHADVPSMADASVTDASVTDASRGADDGTRFGEARLSGASTQTDPGSTDRYPSATYVEAPDFWAATQADGTPRRDGGIDVVQADRGLPMAGDASVDTRQYFPLLNGNPLLTFVTVELRGINAASFPATDLSTRSDPWMQNMAVAVFYSDDRSDYGLEVGQEAFSQRYSGIEYGKGVVYEQNLLTSWLLAGYRHRFEPVFGAVEPYVSLGAGATMQAWPLARFGAGFMYMPDRRVRFHLGLEGAVLAYPFQEQWFSSERAGLSYGISLLF